MRTAIPITITLTLMGCGGETAPEPANKGVLPFASPNLDQEERSTGAVSTAESFGIANDFSGKLSEEQEKAIPESLRGAFSIESLKRITTANLAKELQFKEQVAEEFHDGKRYVALKGFRHVQFSDEVSGHMIVIEGYVIVSIK